MAECQRFGISVKMITGDQRVIAQEVAGRLGMGHNIMDSDELTDPNKSEKEVSDMCLHSDGFARVVPGKKWEHKLILVFDSKLFFLSRAQISSS